MVGTTIFLSSVCMVGTFTVVHRRLRVGTHVNESEARRVVVARDG
jgi:hypothetical protein